MKKIIFLIILIPVLVFPQLPKDIINQNCYDSGWPDIAKDLLITDNAMYFIGDQSTDDGNNNYDDNIVLIKTKLNGELIWTKTYGGSFSEQSLSIIEDDEEYIYFSAGTFSNDGDIQSGNMGGLDAWIVKLDTTGAIIWEKTFGGTANDWGIYLYNLENGNILAYGSTNSSDFDVNMNYGYLDFWIFEITTEGEIIQSKVFGSTSSDNIFSLIQTSDGGFFTAARAGASDGIVEGNYQGNDDMWLLKLDAQLNIEWQKLIGGSRYDAGGLGASELNDGGFIINGTTQSSDGDVSGFDFPNIPNQEDIWVIRIDSIGNIIWNNALGGDDLEYSSKIFPNEDGTFTVFGTTGSPNNGEVDGRHYYVYNPSYPGKDIWMVQLSEDGEFLDQRCFGNAAKNMVYYGIEKLSDSHYLIAGTGVSRQADPDQPEAPTEGEIWGGYTSTSKDIWFFEIKDCAQDTAAPAKPIGTDSICIPSGEIYTYYSEISTEDYTTQWQLNPETAGDLSFLLDTVFINWNSEFEGIAYLYLNTITDCGTSPNSDTLEIHVFQAILNQAPAGPDTICSVNNQESYFTINNAIESTQVSWLIEPETAGTINTQQDTAIITWSTSYEGEVELKTAATNNCGTLEYSPNKIVQLKTCLGIGEQTYRNLIVYPNPAQSQITFDLPIITKECKLEIKDIYGRTIKQLEAIPGQTQSSAEHGRSIQWNCQNVVSGVYFYQAEIDEVVYRGKIIIQ